MTNVRMVSADPRVNTLALKSPVMKLILGDSTASTIYYVHKEILGAVSLEMMNHIDNTMREGLSGELVLREVQEETIEPFLEWAHSKTYTVYVPRLL